MARFLQQRGMRAAIVGTNVIYRGSPLTRLQVVSGEGVRSLGVFGLPRLVHLCLWRRNGAENGAGSGASDPALHPPFTRMGLLLEASEFRGSLRASESLPNPE